MKLLSIQCMLDNILTDGLSNISIELGCGVMEWSLMLPYLFCSCACSFHELVMSVCKSHIADILLLLGGARGYRHRKWTWQHEFKSWTRLIAFHIALIPLGKV